MKVQFNDEDENLWCVNCKERINISEKYIIVQEQVYGDDVVEKCYHPQCVPEMEE